jgi:hypothetical protein
MKKLELIAEHEGNDERGRDFAEHLGNIFMDESLRKSVVSYLQKGHLFSGFMEWLTDCEDEEKDIGGRGYYTDGKWIWAEYHPYYLEKHANFKIDKEFIDDITNQNFKMRDVTDKQKSEAEKYLITFFES